MHRNQGYATAAAAKRKAPDRMYMPALVRLANGRYDTFLYGHPTPAGSVILQRLFRDGWIDSPLPDKEPN